MSGPLIAHLSPGSARYGPDGKTHLSLSKHGTSCEETSQTTIDDIHFILTGMDVSSFVAHRGERSSPNITKRGACVDSKRALLVNTSRTTHFTTIHASDLKCAFTTAQVLYDHQRHPRPSFDSSEFLREQNFGLATGKPCPFEAYPALTMRQGVYLICYGDNDRFPEGENINGLAERR